MNLSREEQAFQLSGVRGEVPWDQEGSRGIMACDFVETKEIFTVIKDEVRQLWKAAEEPREKKRGEPRP